MQRGKLRDMIVTNVYGTKNHHEMPGFSAVAKLDKEKWTNHEDRVISSVMFYSSMVLRYPEDRDAIALTKNLEESLVHYFYSDFKEGLFKALSLCFEDKPREAAKEIASILNEIQGR